MYLLACHPTDLRILSSSQSQFLSLFPFVPAALLSPYVRCVSLLFLRPPCCSVCLPAAHTNVLEQLSTLTINSATKVRYFQTRRDFRTRPWVAAAAAAAADDDDDDVRPCPWVAAAADDDDYVRPCPWVDVFADAVAAHAACPL